MQGSTTGRVAGEEEAVKKDNDWTDEDMRVYLPADMKRSIARALEVIPSYLKFDSFIRGT